jgi:hypothetical protein
MVKLNLIGISVKLKVVLADHIEDISIENGSYKDANYDSLVVMNDRAILESGESVMPIAPGAIAIYISVATPLDKLAQIKGEDVYLKGIDVVEDGEEREILQKIVDVSGL